jgi:hypothetical protein
MRCHAAAKTMACLAVTPAGSEACCAPLGTERLGIGITVVQ